MITKHPFQGPMFNKFIQYAKSKLPNEAVGIFTIDNEFIPLDNIHPEPEGYFRFKAETLKVLTDSTSIACIIHSHNNSKHLSKKDMEGQILTGVPWGMVNFFNGVPESRVFWGDQLDFDYPLLGREFIHGVWDCYGLVRSYYKKEYGIIIPDFPRENNWWRKDPSLIDACIDDAGFIKTQDAPEIGDVICMKLGPVVCHCAIYLGRGKVLHHLTGKISDTDVLNNHKKRIAYIAKYSGVK